MGKLNGNLGWIITIIIAISGWAYSLGMHSRSIDNLEKGMDKKANKETVQVELGYINQKLDRLLAQKYAKNQ